MSEVRACPECDSPAVRHRTRGTDGRDRLAEPESDYQCESCGSTFAEPVTRESRGGGHTGTDVLKRAGFDGFIDDDSETGSDTVAPLSGLERDLLLLVARQTATPETAATVTGLWGQLGEFRDADEHPGAHPIRETALRNLNRLDEAGLIRKKSTRGKNRYHITDAGCRRLREREQQIGVTLQALDTPEGGGADE